MLKEYKITDTKFIDLIGNTLNCKCLKYSISKYFIRWNKLKVSLLFRTSLCRLVGFGLDLFLVVWASPNHVNLTSIGEIELQPSLNRFWSRSYFLLQKRTGLVRICLAVWSEAIYSTKSEPIGSKGDSHNFGLSNQITKTQQTRMSEVVSLKLFCKHKIMWIKVIQYSHKILSLYRFSWILLFPNKFNALFGDFN